MIITYKVSGRFGNNLFQYYATKILQHLLNKIIGKNKYEYSFMYKMYTHKTIIDDDNFLPIYDSLKRGILPKNLGDKNIYLDGFFQHHTFLLENIDHVKDLFCEENNEQVNQYKMSDIAKFVKNFKPFYKENDIVLHIRLDDFIQHGHDSNIMNPNSFINLLKKIECKGDIYLITDKINHQFELEYINTLAANINLKVLSNDLLTDFSLLYYAPNLICSNSTFSWFAGLLGVCKNSWFPDTKNFYPKQSFTKVKENTVLFDNEYISYKIILI